MSYIKLIASLFVVTLLISSCKKDAIDEVVQNTEPVSFENFEAGQKNYYVLFRGEDIKDDENFNFEYIEDTLAVEIVSNDENGWLVKEYLTPGSISLNGENNVAFADSTWYYYVNNENNTIKLRQWGNYYRTRLFFLEQDSERGLILHNISSPQIEIRGWKTTLPFSKDYITATTSGMNLFGTEYEKLNVLIDNTGMHEGEPGFTHVFSKQSGLVRSFEYSDFNGKGYGWDLLPK